MKKQLQKFFAKKKNNKGFTLIEIIIVIAILAILIGIVGMASIRYVEKSRKSADEQTMDSVATAIQAAIVDPDHGIKLATGDNTVVLNADGTIGTITNFTFPTEYPQTKFTADVIADMAKTPKLNSQEYKNGATLTITASEDGDIKVKGWVKN